MSRFFKEHRWLTIVLAILVTALTVGLLGAATNGFAKISGSSFGGLRKVNENNLITIEDYEDLDVSRVNGIKILVAEDGTISLSGEAEDDTSIVLKTFGANHDMVTDPDDDGYTLSGITDGSLSTVYLQVAQSENVLARSTKYGANFTAEAIAEVTVTIEIVKGTELNGFKITPVVVPGSTAESFYA